MARYELRECLKDAVSYCRENEKSAKTNLPRYCRFRETDDTAQDIIESLAACLEFDGLDNLSDPSPRSSLMITQFTNEKARFVERMLKERTASSCDKILNSLFDIAGDSSGELKQKCLEFVERNYSSEISLL